jgi:DNA-binding NtrC family response regulator
VKLLLVAATNDQPALAAHFTGEFETDSAADAAGALAILSRGQIDALVVHLGIGESQALDVLYGARKQTPDRPPGMVVVAEDCDLRRAVEIMRAGTYDIQLESSLAPGKLAHSVRNATLLTQLSKRRSDSTK